LDRLNALKSDPAFGTKLAEGSVEARRVWDAAFQAAYPDASVDAAADQFPPAAKVEEITIPSLAEAQREAVAAGHAQGGDAELLAAVELAKTYAVAAELPVADASAIATDISAFEPKWRGFTERQKADHTTGVMAQLTRRWGDKTNDMIGLGRLLVAEAAKKNPGILDFMANSGAGSDFGVIVRLAEHGARLAAKKGRTIESLRLQFPKFFAIDWAAS
jgi:hypothetical protein